MITNEFKKIDDIKIFHDDIDDKHSDYNAQGLDNLFSAEEKHFWFLARKGFIAKQMAQLNLQH